MRLGLLGGTFDPPHKGHLQVAQAAMAHLGLDEVLLVPTGRNPLKESPVASAKHRLAMTRLMAENHEGLAVSDIEIARGGPNYTVDTLAELSIARPADYWLIVGADALKGLPSWRQPGKLIRLCQIAVVLRGSTVEAQLLGSLPKHYRERITLVPMDRIDISSSELRDRIGKGMPVAEWLEPSVHNYIRENGLYQARSSQPSP